MVYLIIANSTCVEVTISSALAVVNPLYSKRSHREVILQLETCISLVQELLSSLLFLFL